MKKHLLFLFLFAALCDSKSGAQVITEFGSSTLVNPFTTSSMSGLTAGISAWAGSGTVGSSALTVTNVANTGTDLYEILGNAVPLNADNVLLLTGELETSQTLPPPASGVFSITLYDSTFDSVTYNFNYNSFY